MPFAFTGLVAISSRKEHALPDAAQDGSGAKVKLVVFSDHNERKGAVEVSKIVKTDAEWQRELSPEEFAVARQKGTERAFTGRYWNNHEDGLYRCVCCGNTLFHSSEKFDSGTGWPSFWAPVAEENVGTQTDISLFMKRWRCYAASATLTWAMFSKMVRRLPGCAIASIPAPFGSCQTSE